MYRMLFVLLVSCLSINECLSFSDPLWSVPLREISLSQGFFGQTANNVESPVETRLSLITLNRNLKIGLTLSLILAFTMASVAYYWRKKAHQLFRLKQEEKPSIKSEEAVPGGEQESEISLLRSALNEERAKVVRHEVQKKELLAYIEELKSLQGSTEVRHKTKQIQRIFAEQKTDDIVNKVENTAKVLYPELVEAVQKQYPELNKLELQYCMMLTLGYNLDEVMSVLGRSEKAIKSLRYRIRKKMKLENPQSLKRFIKEMNVYVTENQ